jgi:hypothetical protein
LIVVLDFWLVGGDWNHGHRKMGISWGLSLVGGLEPWNFYDFPFSWEWKIIPTDELTPSFFRRGRATTNQFRHFARKLLLKQAGLLPNAFQSVLRDYTAGISWCGSSKHWLRGFKMFQLTGAKRREFSGMIHWLTINNHPSTPQQPIHSLLLAV